MKDSKHMTARVWDKPTLQSILKQFRVLDGWQVIKEDEGIRQYEIISPNQTCVLRALNGRSGYLVRFDNRLFTKVEN